MIAHDRVSACRSHEDSRIRILVVDDHPAIREALAVIIKGKLDLVMCGECGSADAAMQMIQQSPPDVVVIDISLEDADGLDLAENIRLKYPSVKVLIFSMFDERVYAERALRAGASGYLMKSCSTQDVVDAIRRTARGEINLSRRMASSMLSRTGTKNRTTGGLAVDELTERELAVFQMLARGHSLDHISNKLNITRKTVERHRRRVKEKTGCRAVEELMQFAVHWLHSQGKQNRMD